jgi:glutamate synthase (NADPH/NADH) large chain
MHTGSERARAILETWETSVADFVKVMPKDYRQALRDLEVERLASSIAAAE